MMRVPFLDLRRELAPVRDELRMAFDRVLESGWFVLGPELEAFESEFADATGSRYCVGVGSGLDAIELALLAAGIGPGDEVIVPGFTFVATWLGVSRTGATVVPVDVDIATGNLSPDLIEGAITARTRAIVPVHLYGQAARIDEICDIAERRGLIVVEDAAQAHLSTWQGRAVGTFGQAGAFSFYPGKNLGALGDAGAVVTDDAAIADRVRLLRNYGSPRKYQHDIRGGNSRLDELQAALLRVRLAHLTDGTCRRRHIAARYLAELATCEGIGLPTVLPPAGPVWHLFVVRTPAREQFVAHLADLGIDTLVHYPVPPHRTGAYSALSTSALPVSDELASTVVSLPISAEITAPEVAAVIAAVRSFTRPATTVGDSHPIDMTDSNR